MNPNASIIHEINTTTKIKKTMLITTFAKITFFLVTEMKICDFVEFGRAGYEYKIDFLLSRHNLKKLNFRYLCY